MSTHNPPAFSNHVTFATADRPIQFSGSDYFSMGKGLKEIHNRIKSKLSKLSVL